MSPVSALKRVPPWLGRPVALLLFVLSVSWLLPNAVPATLTLEIRQDHPACVEEFGFSLTTVKDQTLARRLRFAPQAAPVVHKLQLPRGAYQLWGFQRCEDGRLFELRERFEIKQSTERSLRFTERCRCAGEAPERTHRP